MIEAAKTKSEKEKVKDVTLQNLINWGIVKSLDGTLVPTNAFILLTNNTFPFAKIQCALFKGTERVAFIDKRDFSGPLYEQIEEAYEFVLKHINLGAEINGLIRTDAYELPTEAIREAIVNATTHRLCKALHNRCYVKLIVMQSQFRIPLKIKEFGTFNFA